MHNSVQAKLNRLQQKVIYPESESLSKGRLRLHSPNATLDKKWLKYFYRAGLPKLQTALNYSEIVLKMKLVTACTSSKLFELPSFSNLSVTKLPANVTSTQNNFTYIQQTIIAKHNQKCCSSVCNWVESVHTCHQLYISLQIYNKRQVKYSRWNESGLQLSCWISSASNL